MDDMQSNEQELFEAEALRRMQKARSELLLSHPFFGSLALKLTLTSDKDCPNLWTDGKTLAYNPHFISVLSHEHIMASQAHEILHIACSHHVRRKGRDAKLWNKACDYAVNGLLLEAGFSLPENLLMHDAQYDNKSVDEIYTCLSKLEDEQIHGGAESALTAEQTDIIDEDASSGDVDTAQEGLEAKEEKQDSKATQGDGADNEQERNATVGSEGSDAANSMKDQSSPQEFFGEIKDHPLLSAENSQNTQRAEQESLIQMAQAVHSAQGHGDVPMGLWRLYQSHVRPKLDWQVLLQRFIENCNDGDYSWSMPNRRYISQDIYLPSRMEPRLPAIALAIDASASIDADMLACFCAEVESILDNYHTDIVVLYHDTIVQKHEYYSRADRPLHLTVHGGGGTNYKHIPEYLEKEQVQPVCVLWFTDLDCSSFPQEPNYPVLWVVTKKSYKTPPFGEVIEMHSDAEVSR